MEEYELELFKISHISKSTMLIFSRTKFRKILITAGNGRHGGALSTLGLIDWSVGNLAINWLEPDDHKKIIEWEKKNWRYFLCQSK